MKNMVTVKEYIEEKKKHTPILNKKYEYLHAKEYAAITKQHPMTVYANLRLGRVIGAVKSGRTWLIPIIKETKNNEGEE